MAFEDGSLSCSIGFVRSIERTEKDGYFPNGNGEEEDDDREIPQRHCSEPGDKFLLQVSKEKTTTSLWTKLKGLYMTKPLVNRLYLKQALYSFKMSEDKLLTKQLNMFNKLILDLENIDITISDEDQVWLLWCALLRTHAHIKETLLYGSESLTYEEV